MLLVKHALSKDFIDAAVGEPYLIRDEFLKVFPSPKLDITPELLEYPNPQGYPPLVKILEDHFQAPVIITNGAKQGLYLILRLTERELNKWDGQSNKIGICHLPIWALLPELVEEAGLYLGSSSEINLVVSPNNPDGWVITDKERDLLKDRTVFHDAAYHTQSYFPLGTKVSKSIGDLEIYSFSKMLGIPGLRLGCIVIRNTKWLNTLIHMMELVTVGVSKLSQLYLTEIFTHASSQDWDKFHLASQEALHQNKVLISKCTKIEFPQPLEYAGMFGWGKIKENIPWEDRKIRVLDGITSGYKDMVRINLALPTEQLINLIERIEK